MTPDLEELELDLVLEAVYRYHGYDLRDYARASLRRRIDDYCRSEKLEHRSALIPLLLREDGAIVRFLRTMSLGVTGFFRDPDFFVRLGELVATELTPLPFLKIWHAGCSTGEEVYSAAILFHDMGLLERTRLYGTDFHHEALEVASEGIYPLKDLQDFRAGYIQAGGRGDSDDYLSTAAYESARMADFLRDRITFAHHNLVTDQSFGEMNVILCRNVLIYFNATLQSRVVRLLADSLPPGGLLCLGSQESLGSANSGEFTVADRRHRIFRRVEGSR